MPAAIFTNAVNNVKLSLEARSIAQTAVTALHSGCVSHIVMIKDGKLVVWKINRHRFIKDLTAADEGESFRWSRYHPKFKPKVYD